MSPFIRWLTGALLILPLAFIAGGLLGSALLLLPGLLMVVLYAGVWLWMRPRSFIVHADAIEVIWPLRRRRLARASITAARLIDKGALRSLTGVAARVGVGGLWGGFGWLWTQHRGIVQMYISRGDGLVWIERGGERPWLVTPESPEAFVRALGSEA